MCNLKPNEMVIIRKLMMSTSCIWMVIVEKFGYTIYFQRFFMPILRNSCVPFCPILKHASIIILQKWHCLHRKLIFVELLPKSVLYSGHFELYFILMFLLLKILEMSIKELSMWMKWGSFFASSCYLQYLN